MSKGFFWLASYPKSGNTWFRLLVANLAAGDGPVAINDLPDGGGIASSRGAFDAATLLESGLMTHEEAECLRPRIYEAMAERRGETDGRPRLVKAHDAFLTSPLGEPLMGRGVARGAILVVRDPRDVAPSLANHRRTSVDAAITFMADPYAAFSATRRGQPWQLRQRLLDWSGHALSWLEQRTTPVHLVRYEDLAERPIETLGAAMAFLGAPTTSAQAARAAEFSAFDRLTAQEAAGGFVEWRDLGDGRRFFRHGERGGWRRELTSAQAARIEAAHAPVMRQLGYAPETATAGERGVA